MRRASLLLVLIASSLWLTGCSGGDPEPKVGDNPAAANGRKADDAMTQEQKARRSAAVPKGNPW